MANTKRARGLDRGPSWWLIAVTCAALAGGCKTTRVSVANVESLPPETDVGVVLLDGTELKLLGVRAVGKDVCGRPLDCTGPSCTSVSSSGCVPKDEISKLTTRKADGTAIALISAGATVIALAGIAVAASSDSSGSSSSRQGSYSGSAGGNGSGGGLGSCPRVYSWNGARWQLDSGTFGVSYFEAAPRTDLDLLDHLAVDHGKYRLRLVNEQDETEHTDLVRLRVVDHPRGTRVVPSASGSIHTLRDESGPLTANDLRGRDARELVSTKDDREWSSDVSGRDANRAEDARDGLRLSFTKPRDAKLATLRVAAHNTDWAGQMLGYLLAQRGRSLPAWFAKMNTDAGARAELMAFLVREGMLNVRIKTPSGWSTRGVFWAAGSEIVKEEAFELAVADIPGERVEVELESALDFWSIDAVSIAYGANAEATVRELAPSQARAGDGRDLGSTFARADSVRFDTVRGDTAELSFDAPAPPPPGWERSFVLETSGYYVPEVTPASLPNPGAMDALMADPFAASRLALAFRLAPRP